MTCDSSPAGVKRRGITEIALRARQGFAGIMKRRRTLAALSALDDHALKDIGVSRSEIPWRSRTAISPRRYVDPQ